MTSTLSPSIFASTERYLRVWFSTNGSSFEQLTPDVKLVTVPFAFNAETVDGIDSSGFALSSHNHSGCNITSGTVVSSYIDSAITRDSEVPSLVSAAGFITQTLADGRYARNNPTPQQIALLKWYVAGNSPRSFPVGLGPNVIAFDGLNMWIVNFSGRFLIKRWDRQSTPLRNSSLVCRYGVLYT